MEASPDGASFGIPFALFAVLVSLVWSTICWLNSLLSGWHSLSRRFSAFSAPGGGAKTAGPFFYTVYLRFWSQYGNSVRTTAADDALYLSVIFALRLGHPPLRIPWNEIAFGRTKFFWRSYIVLTLGNQERIPMRISERMARNLGILERLPGEGPKPVRSHAPDRRQ